MSGTKVLENPQVSNEDNKEDLLAIMRQMTVQAAPSDAQARAGGGGGGGASGMLDIGLGGSSSLFAAKSRRRTTGAQCTRFAQFACFTGTKSTNTDTFRRRPTAGAMSMPQTSLPTHALPDPAHNTPGGGGDGTCSASDLPLRHHPAALDTTAVAVAVADVFAAGLLSRVATPLAAEEETKEEEDPFAAAPLAKKEGEGAPAAEEVDPFVMLAAPPTVLDVGVGSSSAAADFGFSDPFAVAIAPAQHTVAGADADDFGFGFGFGGGFPEAGLADLADFADPFTAFAPATAGAGFDPFAAFGASSEDTRPHQSEALMPNPHTPATPPRTPPLRGGCREEEDDEVWPTYLTYPDVS